MKIRNEQLFVLVPIQCRFWRSAVGCYEDLLFWSLFMVCVLIHGRKPVPEPQISKILGPVSVGGTVIGRKFGLFGPPGWCRRSSLQDILWIIAVGMRHMSCSTGLHPRFFFQ